MVLSNVLSKKKAPIFLVQQDGAQSDSYYCSIPNDNHYASDNKY